MTSPTPTGRVEPTDAGRDLILTRTFRAPIEDVWASVSESERTARWFASWTGTPGPGRTVRMRMTQEEGMPESDLTIVACEPPTHLAVSAVDEYGSWHLEATLVETDGVTELTFVHHLDGGAVVSDVGPGWEFYLDLLVASRDGTPPPVFDDYVPSMQPYYAALLG
ncbi:MAG: SRPBCC family protein [Ilumatobacteraceae bacterium]